MVDVIGLKGSPDERIANWRTMITLREVISFYKEKDRNKYSSAIEKDTQVYNNILRDYIAA